MLDTTLVNVRANLSLGYLSPKAQTLTVLLRASSPNPSSLTAFCDGYLHKVD